MQPRSRSELRRDVARPAWLRSLVIAAVVACAALLAGPGHAAPEELGRTWATGRMFMKLRATNDPGKAGPGLRAILGAALDTARPLTRAAHHGPLAAGLDRLFEVELDPATDVPRLAAKLSGLPEVEYAEPVWIYATVGAAEPVPAAVPNDPAYGGGQQAYLANLQVEAAWDVQKSENASPRPIVCIVDGGTNWQHEDLLANMWTNPGEIAANSIDDDGNGYIDDIHGWNFKNNNGNPRGDASTPSNANHGSHTGGLAAMVTNNAVGGACSSWNPLLMAVNASGNSDRSIAHGYSGIVYAAENGARVVSLSWGGTGGSQAEQDIIDFATAQGTLVVGAAGNNNNDKRFYPAAYRGVIAVANVLNTDVRYSGPSGSCYGGWLDVAAPGAGVYSTFDNGVTNSYGLSTGTSMACPVAAGVATLIAGRHPTWGALKVGEQLRISCDNINAQNPGFIDLLGRGRVNARRAVTDVSPAVRAVDWTFTDPNSDGQLNQGESILMSLTLHNYLAAAVAPSYTLSTTSPWVTITDGLQSSATLMEDGEVSLGNAFAFTVNPNVPPGTVVDLRLDIAATGYTDFQFIQAVLEPLYETHDVGALRVSLTGTGGIGWVGWPGGDEGEGFVFEGGPNILFEGALLLGTSATRLSDAARTGSEHTDFAPGLHTPPFKLTPGSSGLQEIHASFTDTLNATTPLGVAVELESWASSNPADGDFVIVSYEIRNRNAAPMDSLWAALWFDWDIDESHYSSNRTAYDAARQLGYAWDAAPGLPYTGVMALSGTTAGFSAIANGGPGGPINLGDGFSKAEKWDLLQGGTGVLSAGPTDISNGLSTGPYKVPAGGRALAVFALLAGSDLADLQANADRARQFYLGSVLTDADQPPGVRLPIVALGPATPNPFNPSTRIALELRQERDVRVAIYDARGRLVRTLAEGPRTAGRYSLDWDGADATGRSAASGVYFARLYSGDVVQVRRLVLAK